MPYSPYYRILPAILFLIACLFLPATLHATDWAPINPAELQMKDLPEQPGAPAVVLFHEEIDNEQSNSSRAIYMRIKVLTEAGRKYGDVQIPYYRSYFTITDVHARTIHADGSIVEFQGKPFDKLVVKSRNVKVQVKSFGLPDVQVGSILEYRYTLRYEGIASPQWIVQDEIFQRKEHFKFSAYTGLLRTKDNGIERAGMAYTWNLPTNAKVVNKGDIYELDISNVPAFVEEEHMPPPQQYKYFVRFFYRRVDSESQFWKEEGKAWNTEVERFLNKKHGVAEAAAATYAATDTPEQKVKKIYIYVGSLDNLSYKPQRTAEEKKVLGVKDNRGVEDVLRQKSGDRDDLTLLFVAMARAAGVPASVMWVSDRSQNLFQPTYLSADQLDALVAIVHLDNKEVFLDPGTRFCPYGIMDWKYTGTEGLKQTENGGTEVGRTPPPDYMKAITKRVARFKMDEQGQVVGSMAVGFFGQEALTRRLEALKTDDVGRNKIIEDEVKSWFPSNAEITLTKPPEWEATEAPLVAELKISSPMLMSGGKRVLLPTNIFQFNRPAMFEHADRTLPVYFEYPSREIDDIHIKLPDTLQVESLPADENTKLDYAVYKVERKQNKNELIVERDLAMAFCIFKPSEYKNLKGFYDKVKEADDQQVLLKQVAHVPQN